MQWTFVQLWNGIRTHLDFVLLFFICIYIRFSLWNAREEDALQLYLQSSQLRQTLAGLEWRGEKTRLSSGFKLRFVCLSYGDIWLLEFCAYCFGCFRAMEVRGMRMCIYLISFIHDRKVSAFHFKSLTYIFVETRYIVDLGNFIETKESLWGKQWYAMKKRWFHNICTILINLLKSLNVYFRIAGRLELKMSGIPQRTHPSISRLDNKIGEIYLLNSLSWNFKNTAISQCSNSFIRQFGLCLLS